MRNSKKTILAFAGILFFAGSAAWAGEDWVIE